MKLRVPVNFIILPAGFCGLFAIIWGGVALSQGPNADWRPCLWLLGGLAVCLAIYLVRITGLVEWISDEELTRMAHEETAEEFERELVDMVAAKRGGALASKFNFRRLWNYLLIAVTIFLMFHEVFVGRAKMADGASGMAILGMTFGSWHLFRRTWTGVELLFVGGCTAVLVYYLRRGLSRIARAQRH